ncbi:GGDEF domain-containing protein [Roseateles sp.]|jgi:diguanylate cyclase (GGDEF)-like protein|uniref:GGDEF domain-containing protein n=1 Tax=Roseateles sp. TaxID=1971397 RepID=UPI0037CAE68B
MSIGSHTPTQLVLIAGLSLFASLAWCLLAKSRRMTPGAAWAMAATNVLLLVGVSLYVMRGQPGWANVLTYQTSSLFLLSCFGLLWAAGPLVSNEAAVWRKPLSVMVLTMLMLVVIPTSSTHWLAASTSGMMVMTAGIVIAAYPRLRRVLSWPLSALLISPYALLSLMFLARTLAALLLPIDQLSLLRQSRTNMLWLWVGFMMALLINTQVAFLLVLRLVLKLQRLTRIDPLTGALNRRAFDTALRIAHAEAGRGVRYSLVQIDMDHFKQLNDQLGHAAGDAALRHLVSQIRPLLRDLDAMGRLGGEEFCLLLRDADIGGAALVAERIRQQLQQTQWQWQGKGWPLRASFGVAQHETGDSGADAALARADAALYEAKRMGRDLVR